MKNNKLLFVSLLLAGLFMSACETEQLEISQSGNLVPKTADEDPGIPAITINGARIHSEAFGNPTDPMVLVLHGGPAADYRHLLNCKELASKGFYVVFFDQRGTGLSQRFPYSYYTGEELYKDVHAVIAHYRTSPQQKVFLLGHSWGAMLATIYINAYPNNVDGAVLCEPGGLRWEDIDEYLSRSQHFAYFSESLNDAVYFEQFMTGRSDNHAVLDYKIDMWAASDGNEDSPTGNEGPLPRWRSGAVLMKAAFDLLPKVAPTWTTNIPRYDTKILLVYSERNTAYGRAHAEKVSSVYPNVQLFETKGAGHDMLSFKTGWNNTMPAIVNYFNSLK